MYGLPPLPPPLCIGLLSSPHTRTVHHPLYNNINLPHPPHLHQYFSEAKIVKPSALSFLNTDRMKMMDEVSKRSCSTYSKVLKEALSINALHTCVYIYIWQLSSLRAPKLWFIDLTVTTCHIQYTFLSLCQFVSRENGQNTKILEVYHFYVMQKCPPMVTRCAKH